MVKKFIVEVKKNSDTTIRKVRFNCLSMKQKSHLRYILPNFYLRNLEDTTKDVKQQDTSDFESRTSYQT